MTFSVRKLPALVLIALFSQAAASPLFEDDAVLEISIVGPLSSLIDKKKNREELPFVLRANDDEFPIKVRVRGKSRMRVCDFPPLRVNFSDDTTKQTVFAGQDKLKLVTHCRNGASDQADVLKEYAAYRIFNLITDVSYKVRLAQITYSDTDQGMQEASVDRYGFFIESSSELAGRFGADVVQTAGVTLGSLDTQQAAAVFVFQYLIGNTDWSLVTADLDDTCCHNGDLFEIDSRRYYVPFDFDLSGLVDARYARPDRSLGMRSVTQRRYRGYCISPEALKDAIRAISARKDDILGVVVQVPGFTEKDISTAVKYLDEFFEMTEDVDQLAKSFDRKCL